MTSFRRICVGVVDVSPNTVRSRKQRLRFDRHGDDGSPQAGPCCDADCEVCNKNPMSVLVYDMLWVLSEPARQAEEGKIEGEAGVAQSMRALFDQLPTPSPYYRTSGALACLSVQSIPSTHGQCALHPRPYADPLQAGLLRASGSHPDPCSSGTLNRQASPDDAH